MILAIDVHYTDDQGFVSAVSFNNWSDKEPSGKYYAVLNNIVDYEPGQFYKRELPCILKLLDESSLNPEIIVIDGYVTLNDQGTPGLGEHLYKAIEGKSQIIGVAKKSFMKINERTKIFRGNSKNPLFITSIGIDIEEAKNNILKMYGQNRIPVLLKLVDTLCRETAKNAQTNC
ncbi:MAG TPA: endonuclease V [Stenomitos sp.]